MHFQRKHIHVESIGCQTLAGEVLVRASPPTPASSVFCIDLRRSFPLCRSINCYAQTFDVSRLSWRTADHVFQ